MKYPKLDLWLNEHHVVLEENFVTAFKTLAKEYKRQKGYKTLDDVYQEIGITKQTVSYWNKNMFQTQKKHLRYRIILKCAVLFHLTPEETEALANKSGLSILYFDMEMGFPHFHTAWIRPDKSLTRSANLTERMSEYIKAGMRPSKESLLSIAITMGYSLNEIQSILTKAGYILSRSIPSDIVIIEYLTEHARHHSSSPASVHRINELLEELELPLLGTKFY